MCYLARVYNPLYRNDLRYLSSTVYPNPDSIRRLVLLSNTMREIFSRILFFLLLASRSEFPVCLCLKCHWISRHLENFLLWITARNWNSVAAINTPSTWHARQGGANREPPHWFQRWNQFYSTVTLHILIYTRGQPPVWLSVETEEEGWRVVMGSSVIDPSQIREKVVKGIEIISNFVSKRMLVNFEKSRDREKYIIEFNY